MKFRSLLLTALILAGLASCSDSDDDNAATPSEQPQYVLITANLTSQDGTGFLKAFSSLPTGTVDNTGTAAFQTLGAYGFRSFGKWVFKKNNDAGENGLQKYSVGADGKMVKDGFIRTGDSPNYHVVDATTGFYWDASLGLLKLQKFNPTTMQRTGEIDLAPNVRRTAAPYQSAGQHLLMARAGKLYADVHFGTDTGQGFLDATTDTARLAVVDIATGRYEKTTQFVGARGLGYIAENPMWTQDETGAIYLLSLGALGSATPGSKIMRLPAGGTDFDAGWSLSMNDYRRGGAFIHLAVRGGKVYTNIPQQAIAADFSNLASNMWEYNAIDIASKQATRLGGLPVADFNGSSESIREIDGKLSFLVTAPGFNGFYQLTPGSTTATEAFRVSGGGSAQGLALLK